MKKNIRFMVLVGVLLTFILIFATGCNYKLKTNTEYNLYTFEPLKGTFAKNISKYVFTKNTYSMYDNTNTLADYGEYQSDSDVISLIPDKIGDENRINATNSIILYKDYLIDLSYSNIVFRSPETVYGERSSLEGIYEDTIKLKDGKVYQSRDDSASPDSFTEQIGTYSLNKDKDFITLYVDEEGTMSFLIFSFTNRLGAEVKGLTPAFYTCKKIKFKEVSPNVVELQQTIFGSKSVNDGIANYELALIGYPNKNKITSGVTYSVLSSNPTATIENNQLKVAGTGAIEIEYTYKHFKDSVWVYIVDFSLIPDNPDSARTFYVGDTASYEDIISAVANYEKYYFTYFSVEIKNTTKAKAQMGEVEFLETGTIEVDLILRNAVKKADDAYEVVEIKQTVFLIIV